MMDMLWYPISRTLLGVNGDRWVMPTFVGIVPRKGREAGYSPAVRAPLAIGACEGYQGTHAKASRDLKVLRAPAWQAPLEALASTAAADMVLLLSAAPGYGTRNSQPETAGGA